MVTGRPILSFPRSVCGERLRPLADMLNHVPSPTDARYHLLATADQCVAQGVPGWQ